MKESKEHSRRNFIKQSAMAGGAILLPMQGIAEHLILNQSVEPLNISIFSKCLQFLDYKDMSEASKEMGFDGVDLTVRPKGHVLPERVVDDLPKATEIMKSYELAPQLFSTSIGDADNAINRKVLETASQLGYQYYRVGWFKYKRENDILETVKFAKKQLKDLARLNRKLGISGSYQNHSGHYFGSGIWDLHEALEKLSPKHLGSQYDIMHATLEGGKGWEIGFKLIQPYINTIVLKDFIWAKKDNKWARQYVPIGEGMIDFNRYFALLKKYKINAPVSIHVEYDLGGAEHGGTPSISHQEVLKRIKKDLDFVRTTWEKA